MGGRRPVDRRGEKAAAVGVERLVVKIDVHLIAEAEKVATAPFGLVASTVSFACPVITGAVVSCTVIDGEEPSAVSAPPDDDFCFADHVCAPFVEGAVAATVTAAAGADIKAVAAAAEEARQLLPVHGRSLPVRKGRRDAERLQQRRFVGS